MAERGITVRRVETNGTRAVVILDSDGCPTGEFVSVDDARRLDEIAAEIAGSAAWLLGGEFADRELPDDAVSRIARWIGDARDQAASDWKRLDIAILSATSDLQCQIDELRRRLTEPTRDAPAERVELTINEGRIRAIEAAIGDLRQGRTPADFGKAGVIERLGSLDQRMNAVYRALGDLIERFDN